MAVPKRRLSKSRQNSRRANWDVIKAPTLSNCANCGAPVRPHHVCAQCGQYRGRAVLADLTAQETAAPSESAE
jgi:large subunit ribosomal protein L32